MTVCVFHVSRGDRQLATRVGFAATQVGAPPISTSLIQVKAPDSRTSAVNHRHSIFARLLCHIVDRCTGLVRDQPAPHAAGVNGSIWNLSAHYARVAAAQVAHAQHSLHGCIVVACWQACEKKNAGHGRRWSEWTGSSEAHAKGAHGHVARVRRRAA